MNREQTTDNFFYSAQRHAREIGYDTEWVHEVSLDKMTAQDFWEEYIWVVYSSNFKVEVLERRKSRLYQAYGDWKTLESENKESVLKVINSRAKWNAVHRTAIAMQMFGWNDFKKTYLDKIDSMIVLGFVGPKTKYHLARNLGFDVAKPDRWMCRIAHKLGWENVDSMCDYLANKHGLKVKEIDIILWKFASDLGLD